MSILDMRILKIASCPTCTAKATVTYQIGCTADNQIKFKVVANSGGGLFSAEWIALSAIKEAFDTSPRVITSYTMMKLFRGKSINTPGFLMAALKHEGLVKNLEGKQRGYEQLDHGEFMSSINALIASDVSLSDKTPTTIKKSTPPAKSKKSSAVIDAPIAFPLVTEQAT
jgi:hypothetical protein